SHRLRIGRPRDSLMRRRAFVGPLLMLLGLGVSVRAREALRTRAAPLSCPQIVAWVEDGEDHLACFDDRAMATCADIRPGYRYQGCREVGPIPGAVLLMRGLPLSASRASVDDLTALPGIGPGLAGRLATARAVKPFCSVEDLEGVS